MDKGNRNSGTRRAGTLKRYSDSAGAQVLRANDVDFPEPLRLVHSCYAVKLCLSGCGAALRYRGENHAPCIPGQVSVFMPFEPVVSMPSVEVTSFITLLVEPDIISFACHGFDGYAGGSPSAPITGSGDLVGEMLTLNRDLAAGVPLEDAESRIASIVELLSGVMHVGNAPIHPSMVYRVREILLDRLSESVPLHDIEQECGMSRFHLIRMFRAHFGMPPHEFHVRARLARASVLLSRGFAQADVAQQMGFFDQSHLHRHFRRVFGMSPGAFQREFVSSPVQQSK